LVILISFGDGIMLKLNCIGRPILLYICFMEDAKIIIPKPCDKGWNNMTPLDNGRHCDSCNKIVVDFTAMNLEEIKGYFSKNVGQKICGHYKVTQVTIQRPALHRQLIRLYEYVEYSISINIFKVVSLSIIALCMTIVGCQNHTEGEKPIINPNNTEHQTTGDTTFVNPTEHQTKKDSIKIKSNDTLFVEGEGA